VIAYCPESNSRVWILLTATRRPSLLLSNNKTLLALFSFINYSFILRHFVQSTMCEFLSFIVDIYYCQMSHVAINTWAKNVEMAFMYASEHFYGIFKAHLTQSTSTSSHFVGYINIEFIIYFFINKCYSGSGHWQWYQSSKHTRLSISDS